MTGHFNCFSTAAGYPPDLKLEVLTDLDRDLTIANVVPQDIGRVLVKLLNNAIFAVGQKSKTMGQDYKPQVEQRTTANHNRLMITVRERLPG